MLHFAIMWCVICLHVISPVFLPVVSHLQSTRPLGNDWNIGRVDSLADLITF